MNKFVFKKVAELTTEKTELAEVKVDLALVDEAKKIVNELTKKSEEFGQETLAIISAKNRLGQKIDNLRQSIPPAKKVVQDFNKQLKDLGITEPTTIVNSMMVAIEKAEKIASDFEKNFLI